MNEQPNMIIIPPTKKAEKEKKKVIKRKVAAYARVSTSQEEQHTSYVTQVRHYTKYIQENKDWTFVKVYSDDGITGTSTKHREGFKEMIADAMSGKIDLIITKSVSRFARNTIDTLTNVRKLKEQGVEVFFEEQNIHTLDSTGETILTIMSSLAQEESRNISENVKWGIHKKFANGEYSVCYSRFLGYKKGENNKLEIDENEVAIVREIYDLFMKGMGTAKIAQQLTTEHRRTPSGLNSVWLKESVRAILTNEKYKGDALLQKFCTPDYLTKKSMPNTIYPQYYIFDDHPAIVDPDTWDIVQLILERRDELRIKGNHVLTGKVYCGKCGNLYTSCSSHPNTSYFELTWRCTGRMANRKPRGVHCDAKIFREEPLMNACSKAINELYANRVRVLEASKRRFADNGPMIALEEKDAQIRKKLANNKAKRCGVPLDEQKELQNEHKLLIKDLYNTTIKLKQQRDGKVALQTFIETLTNTTKAPEELNRDFFNTLITRITVLDDTHIEILFNNDDKKTENVKPYVRINASSAKK
jgi:DNA invertase Pin-like site-specific DNA recombinase